MKLLTLLGILVTSHALAADDWICKTESSQVIGGSIYSCGVGMGADENEARATAFENAKDEYLRVCNSSDSCKGHTVTADPRRTTCEKNESGYKCYRMVVYSIGEVKAKDKESPTALSGQKIHKGMTKSQLVSALGPPSRIDPVHNFYSGEDVDRYFYEDSPCTFQFKSCTVDVANGKVKSFRDIKPIMMSNLDGQ